LGGHDGIADSFQTLDARQIDPRLGQLVPSSQRAFFVPGQEAAPREKSLGVLVTRIESQGALRQRRRAHPIVGQEAQARSFSKRGGRVRAPKLGGEELAFCAGGVTLPSQNDGRVH
jgi:hypothetical protein